MSEPRNMDLSDWKDVGIRAVKTFVQVFLGSIPVSSLMSLDWTAYRAAGLSAGAAGVAIIWNAVLNWATDTD